MADGISFHIDASDALAKLAAIDKAADRATMWALREVGRKVKQTSARAAPVYSGPPRKVSFGDGHSGPIIPRELRRSIGSSKRLGRIAGGYSVRVGPRGGHVHLYAAAQERRTPFMAPGIAAGQAAAEAVFASAWAKAIKRVS